MRKTRRRLLGISQCAPAAIFAIYALAMLPSTQLSAADALPDANGPASFDCSRAPGVDERLICSDPLLRHADYDLGRAYHQLLQATSDPQRIDAIRSDERSWILRRNVECAVYKGLVITENERAAYVDCFIASVEERQQDLAHLMANPSADPSTISTPIRRSFYKSAERLDPLPASSVISTNLFALGGTPGILDFRPDGTLVVLASPAAADAAAGLYEWSRGKARRIDVGATAIPNDARLCTTATATLVTAADHAEQGVLITAQGAQPLRSSDVSHELELGCALRPGRREVGAENLAKGIDLGPAPSDSTQLSARFVRLMSLTGEDLTQPEIRIDRRVTLSATFNDYAHSFVIQPALPPAAIADA